MSRDEMQSEKYAGPSQAGQSFATATAWGTVGAGVGLTTAVIGVGKSVGDTLKQAIKVTHAPKVSGTKLIALSIFIAPVAIIIGGIRGWMNAGKAKDQFDNLKSALNESNARADALQMQVEGLNQEVATHRKSFADLHAKHEQHASHAAQHPSRAEHGSHADAAHHEKLEAAGAEHGM